MSSIRWHLNPRTCQHKDDDLCPTCDFDGYYAWIYEDSLWHETDERGDCA